MSKLLAFCALGVLLTSGSASRTQLPSEQSPNTLPMAHRPQRTFPPETAITADAIYDVGDITRARGRVTIAASSTVITADEADIRRVSGSRDAVELSINLTGNVHVSVKPGARQ